MNSKPILLFLHGVGDGDPKGAWQQALGRSLQDAGYPGLDGVEIIAPVYAHALKGADDEQKMPPIRVQAPTGDGAKVNRRAFEQRVAAMESRVGAHDGGVGHFAGEIVVHNAVQTPMFKQASNYVKTSKVRAQVLARVLEKLPERGRVVIVAHSLGSVIAADLLRRVSPDLEIVGLVTIGSPLASPSFAPDGLRADLKDPPVNLGWWVNFWNWLDPVCAHRGLSSVFRWMADFPLHTSVSPGVHAAVDYLAHRSVADAVGFALHGSRSKELAVAATAVDVALDDAEQLILLALRYAHLVADELSGEEEARYRGALRQVQGANIQRIIERVRKEERLLPSRIASLAVDLSDPTSVASKPAPAPHFDKERAAVALTLVHTENVILPFEISVSADKQKSALRNLAAEMGLGTQFGEDVFDVAKVATAVIAKKSINWIKVGALGVGAVAIVIATGGLALAAAPGVAGAAAVTSALAAFGPGGMIGGLLTAGTLVSAGGGGIAIGLASPATSAEAVNGVVVRQLALELLRKKHDLDTDFNAWRSLVELEIELRRQYERLDEFSDPGARSLTEVEQKLRTVERALKYLTEQKLNPSAAVAE